ncbi:MAG TPA: alginate lyase family protein [Terriglobia bacterium]|nr:alginate lyase family protein [Terriglobia bacterium]
MGWDEVQARARQELRKRLDLLLYRAGRLREADGNSLEAGEREPGKFFFAGDEPPRLAALVRERMPGEADAIVCEAEEICKHRFRLLGYTDLDYGARIDWHLDRVHRKRAPLKPWYKVPYLEFKKVGDHKIIWELNRHQHLVTLAKAWCLTGRRHYIGEIAAQWSAWQQANPYPMGINWASSLEVAFRSHAWLWVRELLAECYLAPPDFFVGLGQALALNGSHIERYLSTYFSPNTHLLGEASALFFTGILCPSIPSARRWRELGWRILLEEAERQVRPDGVYFEQSLYYHVYAIDFFLHARQLAARNHIAVPAAFDETLLKMLEVLQALAQAGAVEGFGDDDGGRVFNPRRNRAEHLTDPLAVGAGVFGRADFKAAGPLTEEAIWVLGTEGVARFDALAGSGAAPHSKAFEAGGVYVLAGLGASACQMVIDGGPQGTGHAGHSHADALSASLAFGGRRWLIDSGTFCYTADPVKRDLFRSTGSHNTLRVDHLDQAVPAGPFAWNALPTVRAERWLQGATLTLFSGIHTGYKRLKDPVIHRRSVVYLHGDLQDGADGGCWLVRDVAEGKGTHELEAFWHFAPDLEVMPQADAFLVRESQPRTPADSADSGVRARLAFVPTRDPQWMYEIASRTVSPAYGSEVTAQAIRISARVRLPAECAVMMVPLAESSGEAPAAGRLSWWGAEMRKDQRAASAYRYQGRRGAHCFFFADAAGRWNFGGWASDARFLYCRVEERRLRHFVMAGGSFAEYRERRLFALEHTVDRLEWRHGTGEPQAQASEESARQALSQALEPAALESLEVLE